MSRPFNSRWTPTPIICSPGTYTLTARAIDIFNNEATSAPVKVVIGTQFGWTHAATWISRNSATDASASLPPIYSPAFPSGGTSLERQPFSNLITPPATWSDSGMLLPALNASRVRLSPTADPVLEAFGLLPVKSMPTQETLTLLPQLTVQGMTQAPSLSALPSQLSPPSTVNNGITPARGWLFTPVTAPSLPAQDKTRGAVQPDAPLLAIPVTYSMPNAKAAPELGLLIVPELSVLAPVITPAAPGMVPVASGKTPAVRVSAPAVPVLAPVTTVVAPTAPAVTPTALVVVSETPVVRPVQPAPAEKLAPSRPIQETSIGKSIGISSAPAFSLASAVPGGPAAPAGTTPVTWAEMIYPEVPALSLPAAGNIMPASSLPDMHAAPALTPLLLAKAVPSADAVSTENSFELTPVRVARTPNPASSSPAVSPSPAQLPPSIQLHGPYAVKAGDTWVKIASALFDNP